MASKRVAKPADIFVVAQSQMRGVWIQVPTLCMSVPCTCSAATDFKSTISSVKSSQRFAACLGITLGGLGLITQCQACVGKASHVLNWKPVHASTSPAQACRWQAAAWASPGRQPGP